MQKVSFFKVSQLHFPNVIKAQRHLAWSDETSQCGGQRCTGRCPIDIATWSWATVLKEPSTPGNELPAWCISLTGRDCCGATWYCKSSNSLTSHFSSITLPWSAKESFTRTYTDCLSTCQLALESDCHVAAAAHPVPSSANSVILTWFNVTAAGVVPFFLFTLYKVVSCPFYFHTSAVATDQGVHIHIHINALQLVNSNNLKM